VRGELVGQLKNGVQPRHLYVRQLEKVAHRSLSLRRLSYAARAKSIGPDRRRTGTRQHVTHNLTEGINTMS
jgi:hypothetical protein